MSNTRLQTFRSLLTERFTSVAVEIFGEVEGIVEAYYEENKRLRNIVQMVLNPELKLPRIDVSQYTGAATNVRDQPSEPNTRLDPEISEPVTKKPKEEQIECDVSWRSEQQQQEPREVVNFTTSDCVKKDPEDDDVSMPRIIDSYHIQAVTCNHEALPTVSALDGNSEHRHPSSSESEAATGGLQLFQSDESTSESEYIQRHHETSKTNEDTESQCMSKLVSGNVPGMSLGGSPKIMKSKPCLQKTMLQLPRMMPSNTFIAPPPDSQSFLARLTEAFKDVPDDEKPLITKTDLTEDNELVDSVFGKVPKGCPLSYQCPVPSGQDYKTYEDSPPRPLLPLSDHSPGAESVLPALSAMEQEHLSVMQMTWEEANNLEHTTRGSKESVEELRKLRLTSHFREICRLKPGRRYAEHLIFKIQKGFSRCRMAELEKEMKAEALREYCRHLCVNWSPCGLVVHPNAPWLGAIPDGLVYDPNEKSSFGLVHVKCIRSQSFICCSFLVCQDGVLELRKTHRYYWHIQGEMMVTGTSWCDLVVFSGEDILVQRIYRDSGVIRLMKKKLDEFFFYYYLPSLI